LFFYKTHFTPRFRVFSVLATTPFSFINIYLALKTSRNNAILDFSESKFIKKRVIEESIFKIFFFWKSLTILQAKTSVKVDFCIFFIIFRKFEENERSPKKLRYITLALWDFNQNFKIHQTYMNTSNFILNR